MAKKARKKRARPEPARPAVDQGDAPNASGFSGRILAICVVIVALVCLVFGQTLGHEFVNYDDPSYVSENPTILHGLRDVGRAFTDVHARNWHPLTTVSHMLDCELFGLNPAGHHFTNVFLHSATALLLFLVLRRMTGAHWRCALVAVVFAIHPLRVESVAWVAERKDVLSGFFFVVTLWFYLRHVRAPSLARFALLMCAFAAGLMAKAMLVTVPLVLLLLDFWPLGRFAKGASSRRFLLLEKVPLVALSGAAALVTFLVQKTGGAQSEAMPMVWRIGNAFFAIMTYLRQTFWPVGLAPFYPHPENHLALWEVALAVVLVVGITVVVWWRRKENPYLVTGWCWFLIMLAPVIGVVQVGAQGWADRYTYLPQLGLLILVTWLAADLTAGWRQQRMLRSFAAAVIITALSWMAFRQTSVWQNSETLWTHTLRVTQANHLAHNNYGDLLFKRGAIGPALAEYEEALRIRSQSRIGRYDFLLALYQTNVGAALLRQGATTEAIPHFERAIELQPDYSLPYVNLGGALVQLGQIEQALALYRQAVALNPQDVEAQIGLGTVLLSQGAEEEAIIHYENALALAPESLTPLSNLAWLLATSSNPSIRNADKALILAARASRVSGGSDAFYLHKLAAAQAATGDFSGATETARRAQVLAEKQGDAPLAAELQRNLTHYESNSPLTDGRRPALVP